jgi:hypothetical protein
MAGGDEKVNEVKGVVAEGRRKLGPTKKPDSEESGLAS